MPTPMPDFMKWIAKNERNGSNDAKIKRVQPPPSLWKGENVGKKLQTWNFSHSILEEELLC